VHIPLNGSIKIIYIINYSLEETHQSFAPVIMPKEDGICQILSCLSSVFGHFCCVYSWTKR
jgi:hypothetical protein